MCYEWSSHVRKEGLTIRAGERFRYSRVEGMMVKTAEYVVCRYHCNIHLIVGCGLGGGVADELLSYTGDTGIPDFGYKCVL